MCISLNNIENVRQYLVQLPKLLKWDDVIHKVIETHETTRVGEKARKTLDQLVQSADTDIMMRCHQIWGNIIDMMFIDLVKYTTEFTQDAPTKKSVGFSRLLCCYVCYFVTFIVFVMFIMFAMFVMLLCSLFSYYS